MGGQELTRTLRYLLIGWGHQRTRTRFTVFRRSFGGVAIVTNSTLLAFDACGIVITSLEFATKEIVINT